MTVQMTDADRLTTEQMAGGPAWKRDLEALVRRSLHFLQRRQDMIAAMHLCFRLIPAHHEKEFFLRRGQPVRFVVLAGRVVLNEQGQRPIGIGRGATISCNARHGKHEMENRRRRGVSDC